MILAPGPGFYELFGQMNYIHSRRVLTAIYDVA